MSNTGSNISKFRQTMSSFLDKLRTWASREQLIEIEKFQIKYDMGMKVNPKDSLGFFINELLPYADHILQGDDEYFLRENIDVDDEYQRLSQQLKLWWPELKPPQQQYIKKQFQLLLMLGAIATKHEGMRTIINNYRDPSNPLIY